MVDSRKGITNLHVPNDVIVDASVPVGNIKFWKRNYFILLYYPTASLISSYYCILSFLSFFLFIFDIFLFFCSLYIIHSFFLSSVKEWGILSYVFLYLVSLPYIYINTPSFYFCVHIVVVRDGGKMWSKQDKLQDTIAMIPDRSYATMYQVIPL